MSRSFIGQVGRTRRELEPNSMDPSLGVDVKADFVIEPNFEENAARLLGCRRITPDEAAEIWMQGKEGDDEQA